ncbi:hypothetical protein [Yoonia sp. BS5-3]|uniref:Baseplate protein J-like domain-containing protein n=1 Tax=Yoonia phaeophyticola TaxID=3137369 RepID=A0ABZ2V0E7_9RHOB
MAHFWSDIRVTPGSQDGARLPASLRGANPFLRPDHLADTLDTLAQNAPSPWDRMLQGEPLIVLAQIMAFRLDDESWRFDLAQDAGPTASAKVIIALAAKVDDWLTRIRRQWPDTFTDALVALDQQMDLSNRARELATATPPRLIGVIDRKGFGQGAARSSLENARAAVSASSAAHRQMMHAIASLKPAASVAFDKRLQSGDIDPAIGLIIAELSAASAVDARLNQFTTRHTDFYYGDVIGQARRGAVPERALLHLPSGGTSRLLAKGTGLIARRADGTKLRFRTETDVPVTPARVIATAGLTYDTDPQVSLYSTLGGITGIRTSYEPAAAQPLNRSVFVAPSEAEVRIGLDIASDMFLLAEGDRVVEVHLQMQRATDLPAASHDAAFDPGDTPDPDIALELRADPALIRALGFPDLGEGVAAITQMVHAEACKRQCKPSMSLIYEVIAGYILKPAPLRLLLGRIVTLGLMEGTPWPTGDYWKILERAITAFASELTGQHQHTRDEGNVVEAFAQENGTFIYSPADMFEKLLGDAFDIRMTTPEGMISAKIAQILPIESGDAGLTLRLAFSADMPPIAPPADAAGAAPSLQLRWNQQARICPVSFLERYSIEQIGIDVAAQGLRNLTGFSDDGPVATGQSFMPFGIRPTEGASFVLGSTEMACKPVTDISLNMTWADLPRSVGGFASHYAHYPSETVIPDPQVRLDYLSADGWKPVSTEKRPLIATRSYDKTLDPHWSAEGPVLGSSQAASGKAQSQRPRTRAQIKAGAVRMTMTGCGDFGQAQYPLALVKAMRPRPLYRGEPPVPAAPYVPKLDNITLGYRASTIISLAAPDTARPRDKVTQVTPFGSRECYPRLIRRDLGIFPPRLGLGTLYIQLAGAGALRQLGILFDIADSGHLRLVPDQVPLDWHYLTAEGWVTLPSTAISSDTTDGLLRSGVVTLDLPDNAETPDGEMPGGGVWLAISARWPGFKTHPTLARVRTNGVWAVCNQTETAQADGPRDWRFEIAQPGMSTPVEANRRAPPRAPETRPHYLARISERLRHRQRAVTPHDIERMVLEAFPDIWRVKCLPHLSRTGPAARPGHVTVVVLRHPAEPGADLQTIAQERLFDVGSLEKIRAFLQRHGAPQATYEVVNPSFDRIQVRAAVRFAPFLDDGAAARRLQVNIAKALSVWTAAAEISRFGWELNVRMLKALISDAADVRHVTDFSVLHFVADDLGNYSLADTAQSDGRGKMGTIIRPSRPWALPLSTMDHAITVSEDSQLVAPSQSGIGRLRIGDMLIVGQESRP